jgi:RNA polymerase sigma-70 factor, ECF subfamily
VDKHNSEAEDNLVHRAKQGDRSAYGELVGLHYQSVVRVVYRLCSDPQIAQDAAQEAFIRAWVKLPNFQPQAPFSHWLFRIAVNTALDILRKKPEENIENYEEMITVAETNPGPEASYLQKEQKNFLKTAIGTLPEAARTVLVLREYAEMSYGEIASVLDIPIGTVMSRLNYARTRLRVILHDYCVETELEHV